MNPKEIQRSVQPTAVIALTGGIASGKTAVSDRFAELGVPIVDTDLIAREVVAPGQPLLGRIADRFGSDILLSDGSLDRRTLREKIFEDPAERQALESLMHPAILQLAQQRIMALSAPYCVVVIPLLAENRRHDWITRVLLVDTPEALQKERVMQRDQVTATQAQAALDAQASRADRLAIADDVIVNDSTLEALLEATDRQHQEYLARFRPVQD